MSATRNAAPPNSISILRPDPVAVGAFWDAIAQYHSDAVWEVRGLKTKRKGPQKFFGTVSGYFKDRAAFIAAVQTITGEDAEGVYVTLNPAKSDLFARAANHIKDNAQATTADNDIVRRTTLLIDCDSVRPSGASATDAERNAALALRDAIRRYLSDEAGWPRYLAATMSGNGGALLYRLDLPNDDETTTLIERVLKGLAAAFNTEAAIVDASNANPSRLTKIIGTVAAKGDSLPERPWRIATGTLHQVAPPVRREALERVAALAPPKESSTTRDPARHHGSRQLDIRAVLTNHGITWTERPKAGYTILELDRCLTSTAHTDAAAIFTFASGALAYRCLHNSCAGMKWADARQALGLGNPAEPPGEDGSGGSSSASPPGHSQPYLIQDGRLCRVGVVRGHRIVQSLANFTAEVVEEIVLDDGQETARSFNIAGTLDTGAPLPPARVAASRFASMNWIPELWGVQASPSAGQGARDHLRAAIQCLSPGAAIRHRYAHIGWRVIDGAWVYLTANGAVGREGIELEVPQLVRYALPRAPEDLAGAMRESLRLLEVAPLTVTAPLWAAVFRAPLAVLLPPDLSLWCEGFTGSFKSTLVALYLSHWGNFERTTLPGAWTSTVNALEKLAFACKDALLVIDDYAPSAVDSKELEAKAARVLRAQGNVSGRARLRSDLTDRPSYPPRGLIVATGEQHPPGQSLLARMLILEWKQADVNRAQLTECQRAAHRLPHALAGYIAWLAPQMPTLAGPFRQEFARARALATVGEGHLRVPEALAHLLMGLHWGLKFAIAVGACDRTEAQEKQRECWQALLTLGRAQARVTEEERPSRRFLRVLATLVTQRRVALLSKEHSGIRETDMVGWCDEQFLYLLPEAAFQAVAKFCREAGETFPVREYRLREDLAKEGISVVDPDRQTTTAAIGGQTRRVLKLDRAAVEALLGTEFPTPVLTGFTGCAEER
jgi:Domain of unknown function (DUF927)